MILRISFLAVASIGVVAVSHISNNGFSSFRKRNSGIKPAEDVDSSYRQEHIEGEENEKIADTKFTNVSIENKEKEEDGMDQNMKNSESIEFPLQVNKLNSIIETGILQNLVKKLEQRRVIVERKLLELYGLKEEQSYAAQLRRQLKSKTEEINKLNITRTSLQADINELLGEIKCNRLAEKQLEMSKKKIMEIKAKMGFDADKMKGQLTMLEERVSGFQMEAICDKDAMVEKKVKSSKGAELEVVEMKRRNRELQLELMDLAVELANTEARTNALSNMTEGKIVAQVEEEILNLRQANENLSGQIERLQKNRLGMIEELVYQRWLNACLRFEVQNYLSPSRMNETPNLNKISSNESYDKIKQLASCLSFDSVSSPIFSPDTDSDEFISTTTTFDSSTSGSQTSISKKSSLFQKIKKWGKSKENSSHISSPGFSSSGKTTSRPSLVRRFSMSMVPSRASTSGEKGKGENITEFPKTPRKRRVSFSDSVMTYPSRCQYTRAPSEVTSAESAFISSSNVDENSSYIADQLGEREKLESQMPELAAEKNGHEIDVKTEVAHLEKLHSGKPVGLGNDDTKRVDLMITPLFFLILLLLAYCILLTAKSYKA